MTSLYWRILAWCLFIIWVACAALDMAHIHAGWLTSYGADFAMPAWLYVTIRSLDVPTRLGRVHRLFGRTPELAAATIFFGSTLTEISQYFWPAGPFRGIFDPFDILAYGAGVAVCYCLDRFGANASRSPLSA